MLEETDLIIKKLKKETNEISDIVYREKYICGKKIYIIYNEPLTSSNKISDFIIRSLNNIKALTTSSLYKKITTELY